MLTMTHTYTEDTWNGRGYETVTRTEERPVCYVGVYSRSRAYGGPEEGGWWYTTEDHVLSIPLIEVGSESEYDEVREFLSARFGGKGYAIRGEIEQGEHGYSESARYE